MTRMVELDTERLRDFRIMDHADGGPLLDRYKLLKAQLQQSDLKQSARTMMITSAATGEGKSLTSINLALAFSQELELTVLLVEADLARPSSNLT